MKELLCKEALDKIRGKKKYDLMSTMDFKMSYKKFKCNNCGKMRQVVVSIYYKSRLNTHTEL